MQRLHPPILLICFFILYVPLHHICESLHLCCSDCHLAASISYAWDAVCVCFVCNHNDFVVVVAIVDVFGGMISGLKDSPQHWVLKDLLAPSSGSEWVDPEDPTVIAETELLGAAASIEAAAKKLEQLKPRAKPKVGVRERDEGNSKQSSSSTERVVEI